MTPLAGGGDTPLLKKAAPGSSNYFVRMRVDLTSAELTNCVKNRSRLIRYSDGTYLSVSFFLPSNILIPRQFSIENDYRSNYLRLNFSFFFFLIATLDDKYREDKQINVPIDPKSLRKREEGNVMMFGRIYFASFDALIF